MKVILYMAISANGYIAKGNDETPWSDEEWENFIAKAKEVRNILIGRRTYELMKEDGTLEILPCSLIMVLTSKKKEKEKNNVVFVNSFSEAIEKAAERGFKTLLVAGGSRTNATALESDKVTEIYLDVEPWLLGRGLPLFSDISRDFKLKLLKIKRYGENGVQLHYQVKK